MWKIVRGKGAGHAAIDFEIFTSTESVSTGTYS